MLISNIKFTLFVLCLLIQIETNAQSTSKMPQPKGRDAVGVLEVAGIGELNIGMTEEAFLTLAVSKGAKVANKPELNSVYYTFAFPEITPQDRNVEMFARFFEGRLLSLRVEVASIEILHALTAKYGAPKVNGGIDVEKCTNRLGEIFNQPYGSVTYRWGTRVIAEYSQIHSDCGLTIKDRYDVWDTEMSVRFIYKLNRELELKKTNPPLNSVL
jgi:hypothetical protein